LPAKSEAVQRAKKAALGYTTLRKNTFTAVAMKQYKVYNMFTCETFSSPKPVSKHNQTFKVHFFAGHTETESMYDHLHNEMYPVWNM
jgi:hypothetical protein